MNQQPSEKSIFLDAIERPSASDRTAYLDAVCGDNPKLREQIEILLRAHDRTDDLLDLPDTLRPAQEVAEDVGTMIGRYKLLERIGEGGMGVVYMAEQVEPLRRMVALKIIKPGMDTQQVIARFEAERQALALMDHPNIARVLDAGATESGRPYFVMELVRGIPITEYCDEARIDTRGRLRLFQEVCRAAHHAHQKGIIHRDIKPTNVLVTLHDGVPVPKIIDFGVAKATNQQLTKRTLFTRFSEIIGTPLYMSPEQAEMSGLDIDTRTDVYSLGVLLYELLTGTTPFDQETLRQAGYDEMRRIIREDEPPMPSARVSTLGAMLPTVSDRRSTVPRELRNEIRGELDWIVLKSMEKDRTRRYDSASSLAEDVQRFLDDEPVLASPPSRVYRVRKFVRRHRGPVAAVTAIALSLIVGVVGMTFGLYQSWERQAELDEMNRRLLSTQEQLLEALNDEALMAAMSGDFAETERVIRKAQIVRASEAWKLRMRGLAAHYGGKSQLAIELLQKAVKLEPESVAARSMLATAYLYAGHFSDYEQTMLELHQREPKSLEDLLFKAQVDIGKQTAVESIDRVLAQRPRWGLALAIRGQAKALLAINTGDAMHAREAIDDLERARNRMDDNAFLPAAALVSYQVAIRFSDRDGLDSTRDRLAADEVAKELDRFPHYVLGRTARAWYFDFNGQPDLAEAEWQAAIDSGASGLFRSSYAAFLYRQGKTRQALAMLGRQREPRTAQTEIARAYLLADTEDGRIEAKRIFADLSQRKLPPFSRIFVLTIPMLLGDKQSVASGSAELLKQGALPEWGGKGTVEFLACRIRADTFLARAGDSNYQRCIASWLIGMRCLENGNRDGAKLHFSVCVDSGFFYTAICHWAKAFLARLERDPEWPNSIRQGGQIP